MTVFISWTKAAEEVPAVALHQPTVLNLVSSTFAKSNTLYLRTKRSFVVYFHDEMKCLHTVISSFPAAPFLFFPLSNNVPVSLASQSISQTTHVVTVLTASSRFLEKGEREKKNWWRGIDEMTDSNNLFSLETGSCHLLIFALLCDNTVVACGCCCICIWNVLEKRKSLLNRVSEGGIQWTLSELHVLSSFLL